MIFEYSVILYSDFEFEFEVRMLITMFLYAHHFSIHSTITLVAPHVALLSLHAMVTGIPHVHCDNTAQLQIAAMQGRAQ
jgi:hypothetical protein